MPLKLRIKSGALFVVNGVVIQNVDSHAAHLAVQSQKARILADPHLMATEEATTPIRKLYFALQGAHLEATQMERRACRKRFFELLTPLTAAAGEQEARVLADVRKLVMRAEYYKALMKLYGFIKEAEK